MDNTVARISVSQGNLILYRVSKNLRSLLCSVMSIVVGLIMSPLSTRMPLFFLFYGAWIALSLSSLLASNRDMRAVINIVFIFSRAGSKAIFPGKSWPVFQVGYVTSSFCKSLISTGIRQIENVAELPSCLNLTLYLLYIYHATLLLFK